MYIKYMKYKSFLCRTLFKCIYIFSLGAIEIGTFFCLIAGKNTACTELYNSKDIMQCKNHNKNNLKKKIPSSIFLRDFFQIFLLFI